MSESVRVALDAMGGDHGVQVVVPAAIDTLIKYPKLRLTLVGDKLAMEEALESCEQKIPHQRLTLYPTTQVVGMDEKPSFALRGKKDSSMRVAINLVKAGEVDACVSAGNTGALMAIARFVLKMVKGIDRPAIIYSVPTLKSSVEVLDLGANVDCTAEHLLQFALMGSILHETLYQKKPTVALLNIGSEAIKGSEQVKKAADLLAENKQINYVGFIEANAIYRGTVNVVVCDGFVGNVALKASEGIANMFLVRLKEAFHQNSYTKLIALLAKPVLKSLKMRLDPNRYNGASLLGLRGIVIKSHGNANQQAFAEAIRIAMVEAQMDLPNLIARNMEKRT